MKFLRNKDEDINEDLKLIEDKDGICENWVNMIWFLPAQFLAKLNQVGGRVDELVGEDNDLKIIVTKKKNTKRERIPVTFSVFKREISRKRYETAKKLNSPLGIIIKDFYESNKNVNDFPLLNKSSISFPIIDGAFGTVRNNFHKSEVTHFSVK